MAEDLTVTCADESSCSITFGTPPLFEELNVYPDYTVTRNLTVINDDINDDCSLVLNTFNEDDLNNLSSVLFTVIKDGITDVYGVRDGAARASSNKNFNDVFSTSDIPLGTVPSLGTKIYEWVLTFDPSAGNQYQAAETVFDFDLYFECGEPEVSPSPSLSPSLSPTVAGAASDGTGGGDTPAVADAGQVWASFTFPDVGGFFRRVLGVEEEEPEPSPEPQVAGVEEKGPEVKGESTCNWWYYLWWLPLAIQGALTFIYYHWLKDKQVTAWWLVPILLAAASQIIHEVLGCECVASRLCPWYWLFNLTILVILTAYYFYRRQKKSSDLIEE